MGTYSLVKTHPLSIFLRSPSQLCGRTSIWEVRVCIQKGTPRGRDGARLSDHCQAVRPLGSVLAKGAAVVAMTAFGILVSAGISAGQALDTEVDFYREPDSPCSHRAQNMMGETVVHQMKVQARP